MNSIRRLSIKNKLILIMMTTSSAAIILMGAAVLLQEAISGQRSIQQQLTVLADVIGSGSIDATLSPVTILPLFKRALTRWRSNAILSMRLYNGMMEPLSPRLGNVPAAVRWTRKGFGWWVATKAFYRTC